MAQVFEDWTDYSLGDDPTVDVASGDSEARWELLRQAGGSGVTLEIVESGGERFLKVTLLGDSGDGARRDILGLVAIGKVLDAEVFARARSTWAGSETDRFVRCGLRVDENLDVEDGYEIRNNAHRMRRINAGVDTYLQDERPGPSAENTIYNYLFRIETDGNGDPLIQSKIWTGDPVTGEPAEWVINHTDTDADNLTTAGFVGPGWQHPSRATTTDNPEHEILAVGIGTGGDAAPRQAAEAPSLEIRTQVRESDVSAAVSNLRWAVFASTLPGEWGAPVATGTDGEISVEGELVVSLGSATPLEDGQLVWLYTTESDGSLAGTFRHHGGPVRVSEVEGS